MTQKKIRKITDKRMFHSVFMKLFLNGSVFLRKDHEAIPVRFLSYDSGVATLKIPPGHEPFGEIVVYVERKTDVVYSHMNFIASIGHDKYTFDAADLQLMEFISKDETATVHSEVRVQERTGQLYLSDIISDFSLSECLKTNTRRVEYMREELLKKLAALYPESAISFLHDRKPNRRMDLFQETRRPYFFTEFKRPVNPSDNRDLSFFMSEIFDRDSEFMRNRYVSEICVPMLYKLMMPFGYIRVNSTTALTEADYSAIRKLGMSASVLFTNDQRIIRSSGDIMSISDMSRNGLGIVFRDKPLIKHFREKSLVSFNVYFPDSRKASILAVVRHISLVNGTMYKVGTEIENIDPIGEVHYSDYIEMINQRSTALDGSDAAG
jgi:hypothetical protein